MKEKRDNSIFVPMIIDHDGTVTPIHLQPTEEGVGKTIPQRIDPSKVHVMTDEEIFHEKANAIDYSNLEVRICEIMGISFLEGINAGIIHGATVYSNSHETDLHKKRASEMFHIPYDQVTPEQREIAKRNNFIKAYSCSHERGAEDLALDDGDEV